MSALNNRAREVSERLLVNKAIAPVSLVLIVGIVLVTSLVKQPPTFVNVSTSESLLNVTDQVIMRKFQNWPVTSMFEFLVIHDSVINAYQNAVIEKHFTIDKYRELVVDNGTLWLYSTNPDDRFLMKLTLEDYVRVREYFNTIVPPSTGR